VVFSRIVERCVDHGDKILTVHSRRSAADVISILGDRFPGKVILHWFSGSSRELQRAIDFGFYFSVGPAMVKSKSGLALLAAMPRDRVLTETDGPFVNTAGRPARPADVVTVVHEISQFWRRSPDEAKSLIFQNFQAITSTE
jgi:TatD DNase family protein